MLQKFKHQFDQNEPIEFDQNKPIEFDQNKPNQTIHSYYALTNRSMRNMTRKVNVKQLTGSMQCWEEKRSLMVKTRFKTHSKMVSSCASKQITFLYRMMVYGASFQNYTL